MSYRSENILCLRQKDYKKMLVLGTNTSSLFNEHFVKAGSIESDTLVYFIGTCLKMYSAYPEVIAFHKWLEDMGENNYHFIRQGEDHADNEELGKLYQEEDTEMFIDSSITYPGGSLW